MSRIFNISFDHKGHSYAALVSVSGEKDTGRINITTYDDKIRLILPNGTLVFSISDLLQLLVKQRQSDPRNEIVHITENITLQLMN
jgi:hypothetical protein